MVRWSQAAWLLLIPIGLALAGVGLWIGMGGLYVSVGDGGAPGNLAKGIPFAIGGLLAVVGGIGSIVFAFRRLSSGNLG